MTFFSEHVWDHWPPVLPLSSTWSQQGHSGTGACPGADGKGDASLGTGAGSYLTPASSRDNSSSSPGLSRSGWWGGSCQGTEALLSSVVKAPQPANHLNIETTKVSTSTPRGLSRLPRGGVGSSGDLFFCLWQKAKHSVLMREETLCNHVSFQAHPYIPNALTHCLSQAFFSIT